MGRPMKLLFISWDGPGPNYHEALFIPIFARSRRPDDEIHLLQYAWGAEGRSASVRVAAQRMGMRYAGRPVWRAPQAAATAGMIAKGALDLARYVRRHEIDVLMPRSLIPAGMALIALRFLPGVGLLFDADGLMADERADFGGWSRKGKPYRILRAVETQAVRRASVVITRTQKAKRILAERAGLEEPGKILVVANGKDDEVFEPGTPAGRATTRRELHLSEHTPLLVYAGSLGPHYHPDRVVALASAVRAKRADMHLLILTGSLEIGRAACVAGGLEASSYTVRQVTPDAVPRYLAAADLGIAFRTASLSQQAVAPIKVGEYLLCGLPVISTSGIGDLDDQIDPGTGRLLDRLDDETLRAAADWFVGSVVASRENYRARCRTRGLEHFSLAAAASEYQRAFDRMGEAVPE